MKSKFSYALPNLAARSTTVAVLIRSIRDINPIMAELRQRYAYRADLRRLLKVGPYMIDDIGLSREEARRESEKPIWKP